MKNIVYAFLIFLGITSCSRPYIDEPEDLISKSDMVEILVDIYTSQQMMNAIQSQSSNQVLDIAKNTMYIFEQHEVTHQSFEESYKYYYTKPSVYQKLLDEVKEELTNQLSPEERKRLETMAE